MSFIRNISLRLLVSEAFILAALTGLLVSCVQIEDEKNTGTGLLSFAPISIDYSVENLLTTKASVPKEDLPSTEDFTITISGENLKTPILILPGELPAEPLSLPVGNYSISAVYGSNDFNCPYFYAEKSVELDMDEKEEVSLVNIPLKNAMVAVTLPDMTGHMNVASISLADDKTSIEVESGNYYYVPSGKSVTASFSGTNEVGEFKTISVDLGVLRPQHAYDVKFTLELPQLTFANQSSGAIAGRLYLTTLASGEGLNPSHIRYELSSDGGTTWTQVTPAAKNGYWLISDLDDKTSYQIRAVYGGLTTSPWTFTPATPVPVTDFNIAHTYSDSRLIGSKVDIEGNDVSYSAALDDLITSHGVKLVNSEGVEVLILTDTETGTAITSADWPYIPQGDYTARSYYVIGGEEVIYQTMTKQNASPAPQFSVTAYAQTSYSRYTSTDAALKAKANDAGTGDKVMEIKGKVSISDAILGNQNYSNLIRASLKYDDKELLSSTSVSSNIFNGADQTGQEWRAHTLVASFTFDRVTATHSVPCHVTGIPYSISFHNNVTPSGWTLSNNGISYDRLVLKRGEAYALTPTFHIPDSIDAEAILSAYAYRGSVGKYTPTVAIHVSDSGKNDEIDATLSGVSNLPYSTTYIDVTSDLSFSASHKVCIYTSGTGSDWSVGSGDMGVVCQSFVINYK